MVLGQTMARGKWQSGFAWKWAEGFRAKPQGGKKGTEDIHSLFGCVIMEGEGLEWF